MQAGFNGLDNACHPMIGQYAAGIDRTDHQRLGALVRTLGNAHVRQAGIGLAALQANLANAPVRAPVDDADGGLGREGVRNITEKKQIGFLQFSHELCPLK
jgi:hypothetical protein